MIKAKKIEKKYSEIPLVITPDKTSIRCSLFKQYANIGYKFATIISKDVHVSRSAIIEEGCIVQHFANVSCQTKLGKGVKLNVGANVMHDCLVGDFVTIAPNALVLGRVSIGNNTYVGSKSVILPNCKIGISTTIGAGAVVCKDIVNSGTYIGNPARLLVK